MAIKKEIELDIKVESVGNLKQQLREAQKEVEALSDKFGATSEAAIKAAKKAAELKDQIGDAKALTDAFNPDAKFKALTSSLSGVAAGFGAFQGALGLVGVEGEEVEKTLLKVQSAMAISEGLQQLGEARDSFKQLGAVAKSVFTGIKGAVAATGIGLLVIALGTIYTYWDDIKGALSGVSDEQDKLNEKAHQNVLIEQQKLDKLNSQDNSLRLQGLTEKEILKLKIAQTDEVIKKSELELEQTINTHKAQVEAEERNKKILTGIIQFTTIPLQLILKTIDKVGSFLGKDFNLTDKLNDWSASLIFDPKKVKYEGYLVEKEARENLAKLKESRAGYQLQVNAIDKQAADERAKIQNEKNKTALDKEKEYNDAVIKARKELEDEINRIGEAARDKRNKEQEDRKEAAKKADQDIYDNAKGYLEAAILDNANNFQAKIDLLDVQKSELLQNKELTEGEIAAIEAKYRKDREQLDKEEDEKKQKRISQQVQGVQDSLSIISNLTELFAGKSRKQQERAFKIQKAVNIASAVIDTYKAANAALASAPPPLNFIAMGAAITAGLVNVKKIASQKFEGGGASSGGGGSFSGGGSSGGGAMGGSSTVITPNFNIVGNNGQNQLGNLAPVQAFVVSSEMTTQQALDRNRLRNATF
jgi:hypothetical protein